VTEQRDAGRAIRAYAAMRREFVRRDGLYRRDGRPRLPGTAAHLWPTARAFVAAVDLLGLPADLLSGCDADAAVAAHLRALEAYWDDPGGRLAAYASDVTGSRFGGDRYYDDNAWVGLGLVALERLRPGRGHADRAAALFRFAAGGWDVRPDAPNPGGVFWVEQDRGIGMRNHDRNVVSNAPNAQLALHLAELAELAELAGEAGLAELTGEADDAEPEAEADDVDQRAAGLRARALDMYAWVNATLDAGAAAGAPGTGLFFDKLRGDGTVDETRWTYNQGSMVGVNVLLARAALAVGSEEHGVYLSRAQAIGAKALRHYADAYQRQPAAFNAILFRNLLQLHAATADDELRGAIRAAMAGYAEAAWARYRDRHDRFRFRPGGPTLLDQSAMVQIYALLARDPGDYGALA